MTGPRQVGKTTLLLELAKKWGTRAMYVAADAPEAALPGWWEARWQQAARLAARTKALLLIDEIHYLPNWARLLKAEIDRVYRQKIPLHVVVTGSAALGLNRGTRETMTGRFELLVLTHWAARDLAQAFGFSEEDAVKIVVEHGGFSGAISFRHNPARWRAYIRDSIIEPAIGRDLFLLEAIRKPAMLRHVFAVCAGHPTEIVTLQKMAGMLSERGALETIAHYLELLRDAYLIGSSRKFSHKEMRRRSSPPKLIPLNNAFVTASTQGDDTGITHADLRRLVENACIAFAINSGQEIHYWREEPVEVDVVIDGSWGKWAVEIKTGPFTAGELRGLLEFVRRFPSFRPLVICSEADTGTAKRAGVESIPWSRFLWSNVETVRLSRGLSGSAESLPAE